MADEQDSINAAADSKPKRPLSVYNFFFQSERQKLLRMLPTRPQGKPHNSHGKCGFANMAKIIARKWKSQKDIDPQEMRQFERLAKQEKLRYKKEMEAYKKKRRLKKRHNKSRRVMRAIMTEKTDEKSSPRTTDVISAAYSSSTRVEIKVESLSTGMQGLSSSLCDFTSSCYFSMWSPTTTVQDEQQDHSLAVPPANSPTLLKITTLCAEKHSFGSTEFSGLMSAGRVTDTEFGCPSRKNNTDHQAIGSIRMNTPPRPKLFRVGATAVSCCRNDFNGNHSLNELARNLGEEGVSFLIDLFRNRHYDC